MAKKEKIEALIDGGKATAAPPLGPALGPLGVNIGKVIAEINKKTESFKGMKVPVIVIVDSETKEFQIEIGTPPASQLIKKELGIQKGSGMPNVEKVANLSIEQAIKVAKMKISSMFVSTLKSAVKSIIGSANSMGILVEGKLPTETIKDINAGKYDNEIKNEITEIPQEKVVRLKEELDLINQGFAKEVESRKASAEEAKAKAKEKESDKEEKPDKAAKPAAK